MVVIAEETNNGYVISWENDDANISAVTVMCCIRKSADTCEVHNSVKETQLNWLFLKISMRSFYFLFNHLSFVKDMLYKTVF